MATGDFLDLLNMDKQFTSLSVQNMCSTQTTNYEPMTTFAEIATATEPIMSGCGCAPDGKGDLFLQ